MYQKPTVFYWSGFQFGCLCPLSFSCQTMFSFKLPTQFHWSNSCGEITAKLICSYGKVPLDIIGQQWPIVLPYVLRLRWGLTGSNISVFFSSADQNKTGLFIVLRASRGQHGTVSSWTNQPGLAGLPDLHNVMFSLLANVNVELFIS